MDEKKTGELQGKLNSIRSLNALRDYVADLHAEHSASRCLDYFLSLPNVQRLGKAEIIRRANLDRNYGYQILSGIKKPGRDKLIGLCIAAELDLEKTQRVLELAEVGILYAKSRRDAILIYAINNQYSFLKTNELLIEFQQDYLHT